MSTNTTDGVVTLNSVLATFNDVYAVNAKPGDAERVRAEAARYRAKAYNCEAAAHRMEGNKTMAAHCETQAIACWDLAAAYERDAKDAA